MFTGLFQEKGIHIVTWSLFINNSDKGLVSDENRRKMTDIKVEEFLCISGALPQYRKLRVTICIVNTSGLFLLMFKKLHLDLKAKIRSYILVPILI